MPLHKMSLSPECPNLREFYSGISPAKATGIDDEDEEEPDDDDSDF